MSIVDGSVQDDPIMSDVMLLAMHLHQKRHRFSRYTAESNSSGELPDHGPISFLESGQVTTQYRDRGNLTSLG